MNVSVIIPAYNAEKTLAETLESLLAQTYSQWEAIVVDDGSTDATPAIAKDFAKRDKRIRSITQSNTGEGAARNAGLSKARHEWIVFLDADDLIRPLYLERMAATLSADATFDGMICGSARVAGDGSLLIEPYLPPAGDLFPVLARRAAFPIHACMIRRSCVESVGKFDSSLRTSPDWDLWQRIARTGARFGTIRDVLALYRMSPHSASQNAHQIFKDGFRILLQGHAPDPRVKNPHPDHANGEPPERVRTQVFYLLSWCAGILLGQREDARPLLAYVTDERFPELYPEAVAQCLFDSATLPSCQAPHAWEELWPTIHDRTMKFLSALEVAAAAPNLAHRASAGLKSLILRHSKTWQPVIEGIDDIRKLAEEHRTYWQRLADERGQTLEQQRASLAEAERTSAVLLEQLRQAQELAEARRHSLDDLESRIAALEQARAALDQERKEVQRQADERGQVVEEQLVAVREREATIALLTSQLADLKTVSEEREREIGEQRTRVAELEQAKVLSVEQLAQWEQLAAARARTIEQQRDGIYELRRAQSRGAEELKQAQETNEELNRTQTLLTEQIARSEQTAVERARVIDALQASLAELEQAKGRAEEECSHWQDIARGHGAELDQMRQQLWVRLGRRLSIIQEPRIKVDTVDDREI